MEVRNAQPLHTSINVNSSKNGDSTPTVSKIIIQELSDESRAEIYSRCWVNFTHDTVVTEGPNFINLGLLAIHTSDELGSFSILDTSIVRPTDGYKYILSGLLVGEVAAARMSGTRSEQNYSSKTDFKSRRKN